MYRKSDVKDEIQKEVESSKMRMKSEYKKSEFGNFSPYKYGEWLDCTENQTRIVLIYAYLQFVLAYTNALSIYLINTHICDTRGVCFSPRIALNINSCCFQNAIYIVYIIYDGITSILIVTL